MYFQAHLEAILSEDTRIVCYVLETRSANNIGSMKTKRFAYTKIWLKAFPLPPTLDILLLR